MTRGFKFGSRKVYTIDKFYLRIELILPTKNKKKSITLDVVFWGDFEYRMFSKTLHFLIKNDFFGFIISRKNLM